MMRFIYWVRKCLRGKNKYCKGICMTCAYYEQCKTILDMMSGKLDIVNAYLTHKITAEGDLGKADILKKLINSGKKAEKATAKAEKKNAKAVKKSK